MRTLLVLALSALALVAGASARPERAEEELRAFQRPARPTDRAPSVISRLAEVVASRRVATYTDRRGRFAALYVVKRRRNGAVELCTFLVRSNGAGGGCSPQSQFFRPGHRVSAGSGRLFAGIAANEVTRVVLIGSRGTRHRMRLTADNGFIHDCRAYNGCACLIAWLDAYDARGHRVTHESWLSTGCGPRD